VFLAVGETDFPQKLPRALFYLFLLRKITDDAQPDHRRQHHILDGVEVGKQVIKLKDEAEHLVAAPRKFERR